MSTDPRQQPVTRGELEQVIEQFYTDMAELADTLRAEFAGQQGQQQSSKSAPRVQPGSILATLNAKRTSFRQTVGIEKKT